MVIREPLPGIGRAVAERTVLRKIPTGPGTWRWETWGEVAERVAFGNTLLARGRISDAEREAERRELAELVAKGAVLLSGRHLQHGDGEQPQRNMEVFTNCATAATSFLSFYLLLNGSGVGRLYDSEMILVDWDFAPNLRCVLSHEHPDFDWSAHESVRDARHKYHGDTCIWFTVPDSREGWAEAVMLWETLAFARQYRDHTLVLDFSHVRPRGSPIRGMQNRPSSGPVPLMNALAKCATIKGAGMPRWKQALYIDHYLAECVLVGGARRSARMAVMSWYDPDVVDFVRVKRPVEYAGMSAGEILAWRAERRARGLPNPLGFLWSANNSVLVDETFWTLVREADALPPERRSRRHARALAIFDEIVACSYADGTGEPGIINADRLVFSTRGIAAESFEIVDPEGKLALSAEAREYLAAVKRAYLSKRVPFKAIVNPCSEIVLSAMGGYCVIGDVAPFFADDLAEGARACAAVARALVRTNTMPALYRDEVARTNRIGVSLTGVHEFAWRFFRVGFRDLIAETPEAFGERIARAAERLGADSLRTVAEALAEADDARERAAGFWACLAWYREETERAADSYAKRLGLAPPHTVTTIKPAGTTSKLYSLCEGWHLPAMRRYLRWVQFRSDDPLVREYRAQNYPTRELKTYSGTTIVGFPTETTICRIGMADEDIVTASEAAPEEQYRWLALGEYFWIRGVDVHGRPVARDRGNQISYTLKIDTAKVTLEEYRRILLEQQSRVRCCSVLPVSSDDLGAYEYLPEEPVTKIRYEEIATAIAKALAEDIGREHLECAGGACPVDFREKT